MPGIPARPSRRRTALRPILQRASGRQVKVLRDELLHIAGSILRDRCRYLPGAAVAAFRDDFHVDEPEHVKLRDDVGDATLGERPQIGGTAQFLIMVVDLSSGQKRPAVALGEREYGVHDSLELLRLIANHVKHAVPFNLPLGLIKMLNGDLLEPVALRNLASDAQQFYRASRVPVVASCECRALLYDAWLDDARAERLCGPLRENILYLQSVVRGEDDFLLTEDKEDELFLHVYLGDKGAVHLISGQACRWDVRAKLPGKECEKPVFRVSLPLHFAVDVDTLEWDAFFLGDRKELFGRVLHGHALSGACLPVDEQVAGLLQSQGRGEHLGDALHLLVPMQELLWGVIAFQYTLVEEDAVPAEILFKIRGETVLHGWLPSEAEVYKDYDSQM